MQDGDQRSPKSQCGKQSLPRALLIPHLYHDSQAAAGHFQAKVRPVPEGTLMCLRDTLF